MKNLPIPKPGTTYERVEAEIIRLGQEKFIGRAISETTYEELKTEMSVRVGELLHEFFDDAFLITPAITPSHWTDVVKAGKPRPVIGVTLLVKNPEGETILLFDAFQQYFNL